MNEKELIVTAGNHSRKFCPVEAELDLQGMPDFECIKLVETDSQNEVPCQYEVLKQDKKIKVYWIVDDLPQGEQKKYILKLDKKCGGERPPSVKLTDVPTERVDITIQGQLFTSYHYGKGVVRPYLFPLIGPNGKSVTNNGPKDHIHHRSLWVAHGDVNGVDNWSEMEKCGRTVHKRFNVLSSGVIFAVVSSQSDWVSNEGRKILQEKRIIKIYNLPAYGRIIDINITLHASEEDVVFADTKEAGILSVRVAESMEVKNGGKIENSYGGINETETWGKRAHWCDYSGPVTNSDWMGITVFDHPSNPRHPTYWHVRDYGLMTANIFGISVFEKNPHKSGEYVINHNEKSTFAYRIYIHNGDAAKGQVKGKYHDYINPPIVTCA